MTGLIAQVGSDAAEKGLTSLASGDYGVLGIILAIVLALFIVFGIFYIRSTQAALSSKTQRDELQEMLQLSQDSNSQLMGVIQDKDKLIADKDTEIKRLNEDRVTNAKTSTEAVIKATNSISGLVPMMQQLLARGGA